MEIILNEKAYHIRKVTNRELRDIMTSLTSKNVTADEIKNEASIAENLDMFADAIVMACQSQFTTDELLDSTPDELLSLIEGLFELNNVSSIMSKVGKMKAQLG